MDPKASVPKLTLHIMPSGEQDVKIKCKFMTATSSNQGERQLTARAGMDNIVLLNYNEMFDVFTTSNKLFTVKDPRIIIEASSDVKIIARYYTDNDGVSASGDAYLLPTTDLIGNSYYISLPKALDKSNQLVSIMATEFQDVKGTAKVYSFGVLQYTFDFNLESTFGSDQATLVTNSMMLDTSIHIEANGPFYVTAVVPRVDLSRLSMNAASGKSGDVSDYVAFMPAPISTYDCTTTLSKDEVHLITNAYSKFIYVAPNDLKCEDNINSLSVTCFQGKDSPVKETISSNSGSKYTIFIVPQFAILSHYTGTSMSRVGGTMDANILYLTNAFINTIPETTQYLTGPTNFVTFSASSFLEIYGINLDKSTFMIDGKNVPNAIIAQYPLDIINPAYQSYTIMVPLFGSHTFYAKGSYVVYVIGFNADNSQSVYSYLAGYGKSQLSTVPTKNITPGGPPTTTLKPGTTTKASSILSTQSSLFTACLLYFMI
uniref:IgGFc_binding domain-containing protein n=1 Tax=Rhabditophanes sp. KR3021 TaxID=114890 RepID=A0AC35TT48_9BILA